MTWMELIKKHNTEFVSLGTFWSGDWDVPEDEIYALTTGRDRLEVLRKSTYDTSKVEVNTNLYDIAENILKSAELLPTQYWIDDELKDYEIPYAYFDSQSHREALRKIAEACVGQVYCDREGIIRIEGASYLESKNDVDLVITKDDYFRKNNPAKGEEIANSIEVETQFLNPGTPKEVYRSNEAISINANETLTVNVTYNDKPCINAIASLAETSGDVTIDDVEYYATNADVTLKSISGGTAKIVVNATPLIIQSRDKIVAKDEQSIIDNGIMKFSFPANALVQTREVAQMIANKLLQYYKDPRRDVEIEWRGNPALELGDVIDTDDKYYVTKQEIEYSGYLRAKLDGRKGVD